MILSASWVIPISSPPISEGAVVLNGSRIRDLGPAADMVRNYPGQEVRDFRGAALLPGLVNVHSHLELTLLRGYLENFPFWDWIRRLTRTKYELLTRQDLEISAMAGACEAIRGGVTTLGDAMDLGTSLDAVTASGLRGVLYQEVFSPRPEEADERLRDLEGKLEKLQERIGSAAGQRPRSGGSASDRVVLGVSPHAPYSVSGPLFRKVAQWAASRDLPVCIHAAESEEESLLIEDGKGPMADALRARGIRWSTPGCSPIQYLHGLGALVPGTLLVHCVRLQPADMPLLRTSRVSVAHCPKSNWKLGHGSMNLKRLFHAGIPLGLGSDSVASNNSMDLFEEMRFGLFNPSWFNRGDGSLDAGSTRGGLCGRAGTPTGNPGGCPGTGFVQLDRVAGSGQEGRPDRGRSVWNPHPAGVLSGDRHRSFRQGIGCDPDHGRGEGAVRSGHRDNAGRGRSEETSWRDSAKTEAGRTGLKSPLEGRDTRAASRQLANVAFETRVAIPKTRAQWVQAWGKVTLSP